MQFIRKQIISKMKQNNISAHALEKKAGLKPSAVQNILYGRSKNPSIFILQAISKALDCSITDLIGEQNIELSLTIPPSSPKKDILWNCELYLDSLESVSHFLKKKKCHHLKEKRILDYVDEVYMYSLKKGLKSADLYFTKWLIERNYMETKNS